MGGCWRGGCRWVGVGEVGVDGWEGVGRCSWREGVVNVNG